MDELILHQYEASPFSQKVRWVMGLKRLQWRSVTVPMVMPKPDALALTGGYRRTPFLQIGADIYCDTALICRVLDARAPEPGLYPPGDAGLQHIVAHWADASLFWAAIPFALQTGGMVLADGSPEAVKAFAADRAAMTAGRARPGPHDTGAHLRLQLQWLESLLQDGRPYLAGPAGSIADVAAAQSVWHLRRAPRLGSLLDPYPRLGDWYERVAAWGEGSVTPLSSADALHVAAQAAHRLAPVRVDPAQGIAVGTPVTVTATDYGTDPTTGELVGLDDVEVVLARTDHRAGQVQVHFPRLGYQVRAVKPA